VERTEKRTQSNTETDQKETHDELDKKSDGREEREKIGSHNSESGPVEPQQQDLSAE
jgi:hypothetical protein